MQSSSRPCLSLSSHYLAQSWKTTRNLSFLCTSFTFLVNMMLLFNLSVYTFMHIYIYICDAILHLKLPVIQIDQIGGTSQFLRMNVQHVT